jgi:translation initiation factor IF-2
MMHGRQDFTDAGRGVAKVEENKDLGKVRVYQVAKELGLGNKELVSRVQSLGIEIKNHMSSLDLDDVQRVKRALEKERQETLVEERLSPTVVRRRSKTGVDIRRGVASPVEVAGRASAAEGPRPEVISEPEDHIESAAPASEVSPPVEPVMGEEPLFRESEEHTAEAVEHLAAPAQVSHADEPAPVFAISEGPRPAAPAVAPAGIESAAAAKDAFVEAATSPRPSEKPGTPASAPVVHRYAPGFKPGMQYGPRARAEQRQQPQHAPVPDDRPATPVQISAADAMKMIAPAQKPKVVITDMDGHKPGQRREMVTRKDLFTDRRFKTPGKKKKVVGSKKTRKTEITTPAEHKRVIRLEGAISVGDLAHQMGTKSTEVLKKLWAMGMTNVNINQPIDADTASILSSEFGYEVEDRSFSEERVLQAVTDLPADLRPRPPVVTVMGHVDHGKTSLLDAIRNTAVAAGEAGGITQHIGASKVTTKYGDLVFLDTPGHEAFTAMRARGAQCTDIVVLVVAADDGMMPQTVEAIDHARDAEVPIIVAVNKIDRPDANPERVRTELSEKGLIPEAWGGETIFVDVSARTKAGVENLLEALNLQAELLELTANPDKPAVGTIIEAKLDRARGVMCTVLVREGTLHVGDTVVCGEHLGKIRAILDDRGQTVKDAGPSTPVEILGMSGVPEAGDNLNAVADEKAARTLAEHRRNEHRRKELAGTASRTYEQILDRIKSGDTHEIKLLVKTDVHGSSEAVRDALLKLTTEKVSVGVISSAVGGIHETDVNLAKAAGAIIIGFNVRAAGKATLLAEREGVQIRIYDIIYELLDDVRDLMQGLLPKERREKFLGRAEVRDTFNIPKIGTVAGCGVQEGKITRNAQLRLVRDNVKIYDGRVGSLRRFKEDVREVEKGYECGLSIDGYNDIHVGDVVEAYEIEEVVASLD